MKAIFTFRQAAMAFAAVMLLVKPVSSLALDPSTSTSTSTSINQPITTIIPPIKPAGTALDVPRLPTTTTKKHASTGTASSPITTTAASAGFENLPGCVPVAQQNCRDINGKLTYPGYPENCPDLCKISRQVYPNDSTDSPTSIQEAVCPAGYAQVSSFGAVKEFIKDLSEYDRPYPIPDEATLQQYLAAGDECRQSQNVFGELAVTCGNKNAWTQDGSCRREEYRCVSEFKGHCFSYAYVCVDRYYTSTYFNIWRAMDKSHKLYTGYTNSGQYFVGVGTIDQQHSCELSYNKGANNTFAGGINANKGLCHSGYWNTGGGDNVEAWSRNVKTNMYQWGCYAWHSDCTRGYACITNDTKFWTNLVYTICRKMPGTTLTWSGKYVNSTLVCARIKPSWK